MGRDVPCSVMTVVAFRFENKSPAVLEHENIKLLKLKFPREEKYKIY